MRWLLLPLALAACSSDPAPLVDSGLPPRDIATEIAAWIDSGPPVDVADDRTALPDFGPRDTGVDAVTKDWPFEDRPDVVAVADVPAADVPLVDAGVDSGPVDEVAVDVPRDGGPVVYDLEAMRAGLEAHFAGRRTLPPPTSTSRDCPDDPSAASCSVAAGVVNFNLGACFGTSLTGRFVLGDAGPSTLSIFGGGGGSSATVLRFATGSRAGGRRSFHVQFSAAPFQGEVGFSGIPGRTVDPALADLWLLGCSSD